MRIAQRAHSKPLCILFLFKCPHPSKVYTYYLHSPNANIAPSMCFSNFSEIPWEKRKHRKNIFCLFYLHVLLFQRQVVMTTALCDEFPARLRLRRYLDRKFVLPQVEGLLSWDLTYLTTFVCSLQ
jgi:hypothetical protein